METNALVIERRHQERSPAQIKRTIHEIRAELQEGRMTMCKEAKLILQKALSRACEDLRKTKI